MVKTKNKEQNKEETKDGIIKKSDKETDEKSTQKSAQEKYFHLQMIDQQAKQLQQYLQVFDQQLLEIKSIIDSLQELALLKKGDTILAPIANGIFVKAKLEENQEVRINVGAGIVATKSIKEAITLLEAQEAEIKNYRNETISKLEELMRQAEKLQE